MDWVYSVPKMVMEKSCRKSKVRLMSPGVQRLAADILEGGKSAFNQRREKYGFE